MSASAAANPIWTGSPHRMRRGSTRQPPEPILDPDLPIIDPHHHLWDRPHHRYLLDDFLADVRTGHNVVATVFEECNSMYRADGPEELRSVGETEFVAGIAAMSASGLYGPTRVAAGIVGFADLTLGDRVEPVLEALHPGRRRTVPRRALFDRLGRQRGDRQQPHGHGAACTAASGLPGGSGPTDRTRFVPRCLGLSSPARRRHRPGQGFPWHIHHHVPRGRAARLWPLCRQAGRSVRDLEHQDHRPGHVPKCGRETRWHDQSAGRLSTSAPCRHRCRRPSWRPTGAPTWRPASNGSGQTVVCSRAISPWKRWGSAGRRCGTRLSASRRARLPRRSWTCSAVRRDECIDWMIPHEALISWQRRVSKTHSKRARLREETWNNSLGFRRHGIDRRMWWWSASGRRAPPRPSPPTRPARR